MELPLWVPLALFLLNRCRMDQRLTPIQCRPNGRLGFTMVEVVLVFTLIGIMTAFAIPKIARVIQASQVNRAAAIVAADLESAFTLAARRRQPMRIACTCGTGRYTIAERVSGTVRISRALVSDSDLGTMTLTFSQTPVDVFPNGVASIAAAPLLVRVTSGASTRAVTVTSAGFVRTIP